ncbi:MAG: transposase [Candidatus Solibacter sp.]|jgi:REP element-mobilizing transposase RayT
MSFHSRHLPHWQPEGAPLFVTWRLHGSLPRNRFPPPSATAGQAFVWMDRYLDQARFGPTWLKREDIARSVFDCLHYAADNLRQFDLHAAVVMPNHVHVLLTPIVAPAKLMQSVKGFSAREANKILGRTGEPFWQQESYDHWVRNEREFRKIAAYIEENPVRAGLASRAEGYRWSSAYAGSKAVVAG